MKSIFTLLMIICLMAAKDSRAQQAYTFSYRQEAYTEITGGTAFTNKIQLPFTFRLEGTSSDTLYTTISGYLSASGNYMWDLPYFLSFGAETYRGQYTYELSGNPGNRILKLQFKNVGFGHDFSNSDYMNFQTWVYEKDQAIEVHFGLSRVNNPTWSYYYDEGGPAIGLKTLRLTGLPAAPTVDTALDSRLSGTPTNGMVYRFAPPATAGIGSRSNETVRIYPNPCRGTLHIDMGDNSGAPYQIMITDVQGRQVYAARQISNSGPVKLDLNSGVYFLHYRSQSRQGSVRILVL